MTVDTKKILRPDQLPFSVPAVLQESIETLIAALERGDYNIDLYLSDVQQMARSVSEEHDNFIRNYYVDFGWMKGVA